MDKNLLRNFIRENKAKNENVNNSNFPSMPQMAVNLTKDAMNSVKSVIQGNPLNVNDDEALRRKAICESCSFFNKDQERCTKCGCYMAVKVYLKASKCPVNKW